MYTHLVKTGVITLEKLMDLMVYNASKRFNIPCLNGFSIWKLDEEFTVDTNEFLSLGKATPFDGAKLYAKNYLTTLNGKIVYEL